MVGKAHLNCPEVVREHSEDPLVVLVAEVFYRQVLKRAFPHRLDGLSLFEQVELRSIENMIVHHPHVESQEVVPDHRCSESELVLLQDLKQRQVLCLLSAFIVHGHVNDIPSARREF